MTKQTIFPIEKLAEVKALLDSVEGKYKIRYRGPRKAGYYTHPQTGVEYYRSQYNANQDAVKGQATGFVVYGLKAVPRPAGQWWGDVPVQPDDSGHHRASGGDECP